MNAVTQYADETKWEKEWQKEYKYGIILIYPPEPHLSKITELRNRYAWAQSSECDAHISLSVQLARPVYQADIDEIYNKLSCIEPLKIQYGPVIEKPEHRGVVLEVKQQEELKKILEVVETSSIFENSPVRRFPYWAHMTIAEMMYPCTWEQTYQVIEEVKDLPLSDIFELSYLSYAVPDDNFKFTERKRIPLYGK